MANALADFLGGYEAGNAMLDQQRQARETNQLRRLSGDIISGDPQAFAQASAIDPRAASAYREAGDSIALRARGAAKYLQQALQAGNQQQIMAARQSIKPFMDTLKPGTAYPMDMDPTQEAQGIEAFLAQTAYLDQASGASGVQSTYINKAGQRVAIMRDGSQQVLGEADARTQLRDVEGIAPSIVDLRTGQQTALGGGQGNPPGAYIDPSLPPEVQQQIRAAELSGQAVPDQMYFQGGQSQGLAAARPDKSQTITPYQRAQLGISAAGQERADAQLELAQRAADRADRAETRAAEAQANKQDGGGMKIAQLDNVNRGLDRIDQAMAALSGSFVDTGPVDQYLQRYTPQGQELEAAIGGIQNSMLALTRVPGVGSQSDLEARIANLQYPSLSNSPEVNRRTLQNLRAFVQDIQREIGQNRGRQPNQPSTGSWSIQRID